MIQGIQYVCVTYTVLAENLATQTLEMPYSSSQLTLMFRSRFFMYLRARSSVSKPVFYRTFKPAHRHFKRFIL